MTTRLRDVTGLLEAWYPPAYAEAWDAVGLVTGDPEQHVRKVCFAVDPAPAVVDEALDWGADLLVVHHPLFLSPVHGVAATTPKGRSLHRLLTDGCALFTSHTNADAPAYGVNEALAHALGLADPEVILPARPGGADSLDKLVVFVPHQDADRLRAAMTEAGAGRIGDYDGASFTATGEGRFRPLEGANPAIGSVGEPEVVPESRVETVFPRALRREVLAAVRAAHPYEEPAYDVYELANATAEEAPRGMGRIGDLAEPTTLEEFARRVRDALPACAHGVRVAGDPQRPVSRVAVASGAGDFLLDPVLGTDADAFLTSDLRHHPAAEFREHDGPALLDVAHWAAEWTWLPVVEARLAEALASSGDGVHTRVSTTPTDPWTWHVS